MAFCVGIVDGRASPITAAATSSSAPPRRRPGRPATSRIGAIVRGPARPPPRPRRALGRPGSAQASAAGAGARRPAGRRARLLVQRPRARRCSAARPRRARAGHLLGAPGRRLLRGRRDRPGRRGELPARLTATVAIFPSLRRAARRPAASRRVRHGSTDSGAAPSSSPARPAASGARSRASSRSGALADPQRPARGRARIARERGRRRVVEADLADRGPPRAPGRARRRGGRPGRQRRAAGLRSARGVHEEQIDRALEVNLRAPIVLAQHLSAGMRARRRGHLVFVSSLSGKVATSGSSLYSATKFGLRGFAMGLRRDLADEGVGVSVRVPGPDRRRRHVRGHRSGAAALRRPPPPGRRRARRLPRHRARPGGDRRGAAALRLGAAPRRAPLPWPWPSLQQRLGADERYARRPIGAAQRSKR